MASATGNISLHDLNPGIDYGQLPNPSALAASLAQPTSIVFSQDGARLWVAAFGSDRVAELSGADGSIVRRIDVRPSMADSRQMRGPRGLVLHPTRDRLYVMNKLSDTISVIDTAATATAPLLAETAVASHDPMPPLVRQGRGYLFDARLSGNGTGSCASCHLDTDRDGLAWDLGDPNGVMVTVNGKNNSIHDSTPRPRVMHPMKGPMTTQTLRGMQPHRIFHWRGDRPDIQSFNPTFRDLLGGSLISDDDMDALAAYLLSVRHHANPNRQLDRSLPPMLDNGSAAEILARRPLPLMLTNRGANAVLAPRSLSLMLANGAAAAVLARRPLPLMLSNRGERTRLKRLLQAPSLRCHRVL